MRVERIAEHVARALITEFSISVDGDQCVEIFESDEDRVRQIVAAVLREELAGQGCLLRPGTLPPLDWDEEDAQDPGATEIAAVGECRREGVATTDGGRVSALSEQPARAGRDAPTPASWPTRDDRSATYYGIEEPRR